LHKLQYSLLGNRSDQLIGKMEYRLHLDRNAFG
jgi:hypothetical protein